MNNFSDITNGTQLGFDRGFHSLSLASAIELSFLDQTV